MTRCKKALKRFRLTLLFAMLVFLIMLSTIALVFFGTHVLIYLGFVAESKFDRLPLFLFSLASIGVGTVLAMVFSAKPLKPMREIMDATDRIADGDYSVRLSFKGPEEFKTLSRKFNHMAEELGSLELLRTDFVNNFSHEFKTPIVSIRGFARLLKCEELSQQERDEYLDIIITESERLSQLSQNVLYLSKIENQSILTDKRRFNLTEQIRLVIVLLDQKLSEKQLEILFDSEEVFVTGNEEMLKQVWINLLDNAMKFSPTGGTIEIRIQETGQGVTVKISDQGSGIPQNTKAHIFDKFYQGDASHATAGNGLGLAIVKKIVDLHGGSITVHSSDKGSTFHVCIGQE